MNSPLAALPLLASAPNTAEIIGVTVTDQTPNVSYMPRARPPAMPERDSSSAIIENTITVSTASRPVFQAAAISAGKAR